MKAHLQSLERQAPVDLDDEFAVDHEALERQSAQRRKHLGKIPAERLAGLAAEIDHIAGPKGERAKSIPLRLVLPFADIAGQGVGRPGFHRLDVRRQSELRRIDLRERLEGHATTQRKGTAVGTSSRPPRLQCFQFWASNAGFQRGTEDQAAFRLTLWPAILVRSLSVLISSCSVSSRSFAASSWPSSFAQALRVP